MTTCEMIKLFLKTVGVGVAGGLAASTTTIGATGFGRSITNMATHIPADPTKCLDLFEHQRTIDTRIILGSLLAFAPGFFFAAAYYLYKQINLCNSSALEYETIEDDSQDGLKEFCLSLVTADNALLRTAKICLTALIASFSALGIIYSIVTPISQFGREDVEDCHYELRHRNIVDLVECIAIFGAMFGLTLYFSCKSPQHNIQVSQVAQKPNERSAPPSQVRTPLLPAPGTLYTL